MAAWTVLALLGAAVLAGCSEAPLKPSSSPERSSDTTAPELGACYDLTRADTAGQSSEVGAVDCSEPHTAQTFAIGTLPDSTGEDRASKAHGRWVYPTCQRAFQKFLALDDSRALRVTLSWAWFRPSEKAWGDGARWYRCDVVGGMSSGTSKAALRKLPETTRGLFRAKPPEAWSLCATGPSVTGSTKVPCSQSHDWRAVTTVKIGGPKAAYPGDRLVQVQSRDFCSDSVGAWMNYPVDYQFGYTWFHEAEWKLGNRRSVCWSRTDR